RSAQLKRADVSTNGSSGSMVGLRFEGLEELHGIAGHSDRRVLVRSPRSDPALDLTTEALAYVDRVARKDARQALVLARSGEPWVGPLSERGFAVTVQEDFSTLGLPDGSMDVVLA